MVIIAVVKDGVIIFQYFLVFKLNKNVQLADDFSHLLLLTNIEKEIYFRQNPNTNYVEVRNPASWGQFEKWEKWSNAN